MNTFTTNNIFFFHIIYIIFDIVFLICPSNVNTLEVNKPYKVYHKYKDLIAIEGDFVNDFVYDDDDDPFDSNFNYRNPRYNYYNKLRFKKNIKLCRKLKLLQISKTINNLL